MSRLQPARPKAPVRVLLPEGRSPAIVSAAQRMADFNLRPILELGDPATYTEAFALARGIPEAAARRLLDRPLYRAVMMLRAGEADALLVGAEHATSEVIPVVYALLGDAPLLSSCFVIDAPAWPGGPLVMADCAVNPSPSAGELVEIALAAAASARRLLGVAPRVAMLSFSTHGSAVHPDVDKVVTATRLLGLRAKELVVDGEVQADAALDLAIAAKKGGQGGANVLVFPDLDAANIGYKLVKVLGGASAYGVFLQGVSRPCAKVSRGASADEILMTARLLAQSSVYH